MSKWLRVLVDGKLERFVVVRNGDPVSSLRARLPQHQRQDFGTARLCPISSIRADTFMKGDQP